MPGSRDGEGLLTGPGGREGSSGQRSGELAVRPADTDPSQEVGPANVSRVTQIIPRHRHHHEISGSWNSGHRETSSIPPPMGGYRSGAERPSFCCWPHSSGRPGTVEERAVTEGTQLPSQSSARRGGRAREVACRGEEAPERVHGETAECLLGCAARPGVTRAARSVLLPSSDQLVGPDASSCIQTGPPRRDGGRSARAEFQEAGRPLTGDETAHMSRTRSPATQAEQKLRQQCCMFFMRVSQARNKKREASTEAGTRLSTQNVQNFRKCSKENEQYDDGAWRKESQAEVLQVFTK
ncbi:uncharacterized protein [Callorhinus ursinus]|uniref:uncharacterized protein n=1 Tax=Callorhinus ursinus TaxID=34884 RepID=UPI003CD0401E